MQVGREKRHTYTCLTMHEALGSTLGTRHGRDMDIEMEGVEGGSISFGTVQCYCSSPPTKIKVGKPPQRDYLKVVLQMHDPHKHFFKESFNNTDEFFSIEDSLSLLPEVLLLRQFSSNIYYKIRKASCHTGNQLIWRVCCFAM